MHHNDPSAYGFSTRSIHSGHDRDETGSVVQPLYQTSTYAFRDVAHGADCFTNPGTGYIYSRWGNPNTDALELAISSLEEGAGALSFGTGIAALNFLFYALLSDGDTVVVSESIYAPTRIILEKQWSRFGVKVVVVDTGDIDATRAAIQPGTKLVHIETPANPNLRISDISAIANMSHAAGALLSVDSTMASPVLQRPLTLGADIVMHSVTKFINGHSDTLGGVLVFRDPAMREALFRTWYNFGAAMDPHQAWLIQRGLKTLRPRVLLAQDNAIAIAALLDAHPAVERVYYPGLVTHEGCEVHKRQAAGPGCLISFELKGGMQAGAALMDSLRLMTLAVSLGGVDTLIQHPASMTHVGMTPEARAQAGISDGLVRLSVGCEDVEDLLADLKQGLEGSRGG
jgi:methionine-gamma-lyase